MCPSECPGLEDKYAFPISESGASVKKTIAADQKEFYTFTVDPLTKLKVAVKRRHDSNGVVGATVNIAASKAGNVPAKTEIVTPAAALAPAVKKFSQNLWS